MSFAEGTTVAVEKSRADIEGLLRKYGATQFATGWDGKQAGITFVMRDRRVKFVAPMPTATDEAIRRRVSRMHGPYQGRRERAIADEERRRWRCLLLAIKAKLEIVATGIASFEEEFLAHIVTDNGETVFERLYTDTQLSARMLPAVGATP